MGTGSTTARPPSINFPSVLFTFRFLTCGGAIFQLFPLKRCDYFGLGENGMVSDVEDPKWKRKCATTFSILPFLLKKKKKGGGGGW